MTGSLAEERSHNQLFELIELVPLLKVCSLAPVWSLTVVCRPHILSPSAANCRRREVFPYLATSRGNSCLIIATSAQQSHSALPLEYIGVYGSPTKYS